MLPVTQVFGPLFHHLCPAFLREKVVFPSSKPNGSVVKAIYFFRFAMWTGQGVPSLVVTKRFPSSE